MAKFLKLPTLHIGETRQWRTEGELHYESDLVPHLIIVPDDFGTDLASLPQWVPEFLIQRNGRHRKAAIIHDYLCRAWPLNKRSLADKIFLEAMKVDGVPAWRRYVMYSAVAILTIFLQLTNAKNN